MSKDKVEVVTNSSNLVIEVVRKRDAKDADKQEVFLQKSTALPPSSELETASSSVKKPDLSDNQFRTKAITCPDNLSVLSLLL